MTFPFTSTVLVVDDDPLLCELVRSYFNRTGTAQVIVANNGQQALDFVEQCTNPFDLILLDLKMPIMDGIQFLRHMYQRDYHGAIGIISGESAAVLNLAMQLAKKHGLNVVGHLTKPLNPTLLDALISAPRESQRGTVDDGSITLTAGDLEIALRNRNIVAYYQPQMDAITGDLVGVEALARWQHPRLGVVPPGLFVSIAEEHGLMPLLTERMIENAIGDVEALEGVYRDITVSINLGAAVLANTALPNNIATMVDRCGKKRAQFIFEVTESKLIDDSIDSMEVLARLDLLGFQLSLDDFGTQYSNIEQLKQYPFQELKIDRSFVSAATRDNRSRVLVESCVALGKQLGLRVVAEGVETIEDWNLMKSIDVDVLQGFLFAKPMPIEDLRSWATSYQAANLQNKKLA